MGRLGAIVTVCILLGVGLPARAEVAVAIDGSQSGALAKRLAKGVGGIVTGAPLAKAAKASGVAPLGLDSAKGAKAKKVGTMAKKLGVPAVLLGRTKSTRSKLSLQWVVLAAGSGKVLGRGNQSVGTVKGKGRKKRVTWKLDALLGALAKALNAAPRVESSAQVSAKDPSEKGDGGDDSSESDPFGELPDWSGDGTSGKSTETATADKQAEDTEVTEEIESSSRPREGFVNSILVVGISAGIGGRSVSHSGVETPNIRPYSLGAAPQIQIDVTGFPLFALDIPGLSTLGLQASFTRAFGITTEAADVAGVSFDNTWMQWRAGIVERFKLESGALDLSVAFGSEEFSFDGNGGTVGADAVPGVDYLYLRLGIDGYFDSDPVIVGVGAAFRAPFSAGAMDDFFPRNKVRGLDVQLSIGYRLVAGLQLVALGSYEQYFFKLGSQAGDTYVASKTSDRMYSTQLGVRYAL